MLSAVGVTAKAEPDPCASGVVGSDRIDGQPVIMVRPECFRAMDLSHSLHGLDQETIEVLRSQTDELRLGLDALARSSSVAWDHATRQAGQLDRALERAVESEGRLIEVLDGRTLRDLVIAGLTVLAIAVSVWALSQIEHAH